MPTFSVLPSIDTYPIGAPLTANSEFDQPGVTAPWGVTAGSTLTWVKYRAPLQKSKGSLRIAAVPATPTTQVSLGFDNYRTVTGGVFFVDAWVRLVALSSGTGVRPTIITHSTNPAIVYQGNIPTDFPVLTPGSGWFRLVLTLTAAQLAAGVATGTTASAALGFTAVGASSGVTFTLDVGRFSSYIAPTVPTTIQLAGGALGGPQSFTFPITAAEPTASAIRDAVRGLSYITETP